MPIWFWNPPELIICYHDSHYSRLELLVKSTKGYRWNSPVCRVYGSWRRKINIEEFELYVKKTHVKIHEMFGDWMRDNETVHGYFAHCVQAIKNNSCYGLGQYSEVKTYWYSPNLYKIFNRERVLNVCLSRHYWHILENSSSNLFDL